MTKIENVLAKIRKNSKFLIPYVIILIASLCGTSIVFYEGMNVGDDYYFHLPNILDQYLSIINGHGLSAISGNLAMGLGIGNRLFYSPLSHFITMILTLVYSLFNKSIMAAFETVIVLSVFVSGIFMYRFALHFTKGNKVASIISALVFVLYPYRLFDAFCRIAFAEAFSIMFLPLFFMGLYDITHFKDKKDISVIPFVEVILGGSLLYLSHNITAIYMFIVGCLYLLVNIKNVLNLAKSIKYPLYCGVSIILLFGILSIGLFTQMELLSTGLYNLSDSQRMWSTLEQVTNRLKEGWNYSGFLNIPWLSNYITPSTIIIGMIFYFIACASTVIIDRYLSEIKVLKYAHFFISALILFLMISLVSFRVESLLGALVFYVVYVYIRIVDQSKLNEVNENKLYKNKLFIFSVCVIFLMIYMIEEDTIWNILPQILLNIQFPWRLWAIVQLFVAIIVGLVVYYFNYTNTTKYIMASMVGFLIVTSMPLIEKRIIHEVRYDQYWRLEVDESYLDEGTSLGFNKEYIPQVFFDSTYEPEYDMSLYYDIYRKLPYSFHNYEDYTYQPVVLDGNGEINVNECFAPNYDMDITVYSDSLIQLPLIYYPGYTITIQNLETNEINEVEGKNIDGLVAFELSEGKYKVTTEYEGTTLRKASFVYFYISIAAVGVVLVYGLFFEKRKKNILVKNEEQK